MKTPYGFSLIHSLVYVALLCMLTGFLFTFALSMYAYVQKIQTHNSLVMQWYAAYDLLYNDLIAIPSCAYIYECTHDTLIYQIHNRTVGWYYRNGKLFRKEREVGDNKKNKELIAHSLSHIVFNKTQKNIAFHLEGCIDAKKYTLRGTHVFMG